jgi:protein TonB
MGNKAGVWMRYDQWGRPLAEKVYDPEPLANIIYTRAQQMPSFPEGEKAFVRVIDQKMSGPAGDRTKGKATASFIVEKSGDLTDVKVVEGSDVQLNEKLVEAIRSTSPWNTGVEKGQPVRVQVRMPVQF